jgi:hypothetical protein
MLYSTEAASGRRVPGRVLRLGPSRRRGSSGRSKTIWVRGPRGAVAGAGAIGCLALGWSSAPSASGRIPVPDSPPGRRRC